MHGLPNLKKSCICWYFYWVIYNARIHEYQIYNFSVGDSIPTTFYVTNHLGNTYPLNIPDESADP